MNIYRVGGSIRDSLLGKKSSDTDWVVTGSSPEEMKSKKFKQIGSSFPVFLHPKTNEEYALARKEKSTGKGHKDFIFSFSPNVTLEEDLFRRDLTINAIAQDKNGNLIDPYNGLKDIENKILRNVSVAFKEDPLRAFRVARFYAYLDDFRLHNHLKVELKNISESGSLSSLSKERVWAEVEKALEFNFRRFLEIIVEFDLLKPWFKNLKNIPNKFPSDPFAKWCATEMKNNYSLGSELIEDKSKQAKLNFWKLLDSFDETKALSKKVKFFKKFVNNNKDNDFFWALQFFPNKETFIKRVYSQFKDYDFSYLQNKQYNEIQNEKLRIIEGLILKNE